MELPDFSASPSVTGILMLRAVSCWDPWHLWLYAPTSHLPASRQEVGSRPVLPHSGCPAWAAVVPTFYSSFSLGAYLLYLRPTSGPCDLQAPLPLTPVLLEAVWFSWLSKVVSPCTTLNPNFDSKWDFPCTCHPCSHGARVSRSS